MLHDLWHAKQQLATLLHIDAPHTCRHTHRCRTQIAHIRVNLQQWHIHRPQRIAQEHGGYARHELPYKAIRDLKSAMIDTGHRGITTVRQEEGSLTSDSATVLQDTKDSFLHQHTPSQDTLDTDTQNKVDRLPQVFNHAKSRQLGKRPFTIHEVRKAIHSIRQHKTPGYDGLPAEAYYHLPAHLLRILAHGVWNIGTGQTPLPPDWANVVRPLHKKGTWSVQSRRSRSSGPSSCAASAPSWTPTYPPASQGPSRASPHRKPSSSRTPWPTWTRWTSSSPL